MQRMRRPQLGIRLEGDAEGDDADRGQQQGAADDAVFGTEQLPDAGHELTSMRGLRECGVRDGRPRDGEAVEFGQGEGEPARVAELRRGQVVGDQFAFDADAVRQPPHHRVVEQQRLDHAGPPADVRQPAKGPDAGEHQVEAIPAEHLRGIGIPSIFFQGMKYMLFGDPSLPLR